MFVQCVLSKLAFSSIIMLCYTHRSDARFGEIKK